MQVSEMTNKQFATYVREQAYRGSPLTWADEIEKELLARLSQGERWVRTSEIASLPPFTQKVLIGWCDRSLEAERQPFSIRSMDIPSGWYWHTAGGYHINQEEVNHWRPLPAPPSEAAQGQKGKLIE